LSAPGELALRTDARILRRILDELLENALRHAPDGSTIRLELQPAPGGARLRLTDEGPGLSEQILSAAHTPLGTLHDLNVMRGGMGLGLPISGRLAMLLGTQLLFPSVPLGTEILLSLRDGGRADGIAGTAKAPEPAPQRRTHAAFALT
jgi:signal transduction histidine kinase